MTEHQMSRYDETQEVIAAIRMAIDNVDAAPRIVTLVAADDSHLAVIKLPTSMSITRRVVPFPVI